MPWPLPGTPLFVAGVEDVPEDPDEPEPDGPEDPEVPEVPEIPEVPEVPEDAGAACPELLLVPLAFPPGLPQPLPPAIGVQLYVSLGSKSSIGGEVVLSRLGSYAPFG